MAIRGQIITRIEIPDIPGVSRRAVDRAAKQVASEYVDYVRDKCSRPNPTGKFPSRPGQYPKWQTTEFIQGVNATGTSRYLTIASEAPHGVMLQNGTDKMGPRPWASKAWAARDWIGRIEKLARGG